jgi:hypothetical protein
MKSATMVSTSLVVSWPIDCRMSSSNGTLAHNAALCRLFLWLSPLVLNKSASNKNKRIKNSKKGNTSRIDGNLLGSVDTNTSNKAIKHAPLITSVRFISYILADYKRLCMAMTEALYEKYCSFAPCSIFLCRAEGSKSAQKM